MILIRFAAAATGGLLINTACAQASFQTVGHLSIDQPISHANHVSDDGHMAFGFAVGINGGLTGWRWTHASGMQVMPSLPGYGWAEPYGTNRTNDFILGRIGIPGGGSQSFIWDELGGYTLIGDLPGGTNNSGLTAITEDASYGVGFSSHGFSTIGAPIFRAVSWTPSDGLAPLPLPSTGDDLTNSRAYSLLPDGRIFGQSASGAWLYSESYGTFEMLLGAEAMSHVSSDGAFFAGNDGFASRAAYWTREDGQTFLPLLDGHLYSGLRGMSNDGSVMVGQSFGQFGGDEVVWFDQGEPIPVIDFATSLGLDMDGWRFIDVMSVSGDGSTIVGTAAHESWVGSRQEGFVLTIPTPASVMPLAVGLMALQRKRAN